MPQLVSDTGVPRFASRLLETLFAFKQGAFALYSPAITAQALVLADDTVARNDQRHGVIGAGVGDRPAGSRLTDRISDLAIGSCFAQGYRLQLLPDLDLEGGSAYIQWQIENAAANLRARR